MSSSSSSPSRKSRKAASLSRVYYSNAVYFPNHKIYNGHSPGDLNYSCISTVYYCFASVSTDGGVFVSPKDHPLYPSEEILNPLTIAER